MHDKMVLHVHRDGCISAQDRRIQLIVEVTEVQGSLQIYTFKVDNRRTLDIRCERFHANQMRADRPSTCLESSRLLLAICFWPQNRWTKTMGWTCQIARLRGLENQRIRNSVLKRLTGIHTSNNGNQVRFVLFSWYFYNHRLCISEYHKSRPCEKPNALWYHMRHSLRHQCRRLDREERYETVWILSYVCLAKNWNFRRYRQTHWLPVSEEVGAWM